MALNEHRHADRDRQIGLARARRANAKGKFIVKQRLYIGFLGRCARFYQFLAGLDFNAVTDRHFQLIAIARASVLFGVAHAQFPVHIGRFDIFARFKPQIERIENIARARLSVLFSHDREHVAASNDLHIKSGLYRGKMPIVGTT